MPNFTGGNTGQFFSKLKIRKGKTKPNSEPGPNPELPAETISQDRGECLLFPVAVIGIVVGLMAVHASLRQSGLR